MRTIFKYTITANEPIKKFDLPLGAKVVEVGSQEPGTLQFWVDSGIDNFLENEIRTFRIYGTGHPIDENDTYVGTAFDPPFVWHLFELPE